MNISIAENFMRSAKAPTISAGVMIAKVIWKVDEHALRESPQTRLSVRHAGEQGLVEAADEASCRLTTPCSMPVVSNTRL